MGYIVANRNIYREFIIEDKYLAGISLLGTEVKSIREGNVKFDGAYVQLTSNGPEVKNLHIAAYSKQAKQSVAYNPIRSRQLLLNADEIHKLIPFTSRKGYSIIPLGFLAKGPLIKLEIGIAKGLKKEEKKVVEKEKQIKKDLERDSKTIRLMY